MMRSPRAVCLLLLIAFFGGGGCGGRGAVSTLGATCGGDSGKACAESEYCAYAPGAACGRTGETARCEARPDACPAIYAPVCGCDGKTYSSPCEAAGSGVGYDKAEACDGGQVCGGLAGLRCAEGQYCYMPVGACLGPDASGTCRSVPMACDTVYAPVCGCDRRTYPNACAAALVGVNVVHDGACESSCTSDGITYPDGTSGIPAGDGCNRCACHQGTLACTLIGCPLAACIVNGVTYPAGASGVPDPASCNQCGCVDGTVTGCTKIYCPLPAPCSLGRTFYQDGEGFTAQGGTFACTCHAGTFTCGAGGEL